MTRIRDLEGLPCRIKADAVKTISDAFTALELSIAVSTNAKRTVLEIGDFKIQAVRKYTSERAIEFDDKVRKAIRAELMHAGFDLKDHSTTYTAVNTIIADLSPKYQLSSMGHGVTASDAELYVTKAQAVIHYLNRDGVKKVIAHNDALRILFQTSFDEVIQEDSMN